MGAERTEITDGLSVGDEVVLADLSRTLVTDDESSAGLSGLGGSTQERGRAGGPPAGFTGGGFPAPPGG